MGDPAAGLDVHKRYARRFIASRAAKMLHDHHVGQPERVEWFIVEDNEHREFDDLVEGFAGEREEIHGWQVKHQAKPLPAAMFRKIVRALHGNPKLTAGHLAVRELVTVTGIGRLADLRTLCDEVRRPAVRPDRLAAKASGARKQWITAVGKACGLSDVDTLGLLGRLRIEVLHEEEDLDHAAITSLRAVFGRAADEAFLVLKTYVDHLGPDAPVTIAHLDEALARFAGARTLLRSRAVREARAAYLRAVVEQEQTRRPVAVVPDERVDRGGVALRDVYLPPLLEEMSGVQDASPAARRRMRERGAQKPGREKGAVQQARPRRLLLDWLRDAKRIAVLGEVGSGKTSLLAHARAELAARALAATDAPLPLLVRAKDLSTTPSLAPAALLSLQVAGPIVEALLTDRGTRWIVLIDELDQVKSEAWDFVDGVGRRLEGKVEGVVAASRPIGKPGLGGLTTLQIVGWSDVDLTDFLALWDRPGTAEGVARVREHLGDAGEPDPLLLNPLTATLSVVVAQRFGRLPRGRASLYDDVTQILFEDWRDAAGAGGLGWADVAPALQEIALESLRERRDVVARDRLAERLDRDLPYRGAEGQRVLERHLGLLFRRTDGDFEFVFRGIAEFLAGNALAAGGTAEPPAAEPLAALARQAWAEEPVRHAVGVIARGDQGRACALIGELVQRATATAWNVSALRPLLVAIRCAADLAETDLGVVADGVAKAIVHFLFDERSVWVGDRVATAVRLLARSRGAVWQALLRHATGRVAAAGQAQRRDWFAVQADKSTEWWGMVLTERDTGARGVAVRRLAERLADPEAVAVLSKAILDEEYSFDGVPPALLAGFALRHAPRGEAFADTKELLLWMMEGGGQLHPAAAALALRADEAPPIARAKAIARALGSYAMPRDVIDEIEAAGGKDILERGAMTTNWRSLLLPPDAFQVVAPGPVAPARIPAPSDLVSRRLALAVSPGVHHLPEQAVEILLARAPAFRRHALCVAAYDHPAEALRRLDLRWLPPESQRILARAAARRGEVRDALLADWRALQRESSATNSDAPAAYAGLALERLVAAGDAEAIAIYVEWLPASPYLNPIDIDGPADDVLLQEAVQRAARAVIGGLLDESVKGYLHKGQRVWLSPLATAGAIRRLWRAVGEDRHVIATISAWLESSDPDKFRAGLLAVDGLPLPPAIRELAERGLRERLARFLREPLERDYLDFDEWLDWIDNTGFTSPVIDLLAALAYPSRTQACRVSAVLLPLLQRGQQTVLSGRMAPLGCEMDQYSLSPRHRRRLVAANPEAWLQAVLAALDSAYIPITGGLLSTIECLPVDLQAQAARVIEARAEAWEIPWVSIGTGPLETARPADIARRLLFDLGLDPTE